MSKRHKYTFQQKVKACEDYKSGKYSMAQIARNLGMGRGGGTYVMDWVAKYENHGPAAFLSEHHNKTYAKEQKQQAVHDYLDGKGSYRFITNQYGLRSETQLQR